MRSYEIGIVNNQLVLRIYPRDMAVVHLTECLHYKAYISYLYSLSDDPTINGWSCTMYIHPDSAYNLRAHDDLLHNHHESSGSKMLAFHYQVAALMALL